MTTVQWPPSWNTNISAKQVELLQGELSRELPHGHVLKGQTCVACAVGADPDDVVFRLSDGRYAVVHLTWREESDVTWPYTQMFPAFRDFALAGEWG
jgi:hypothetical protein